MITLSSGDVVLFLRYTHSLYVTVELILIHISDESALRSLQ